ncbi:hypothetical protein EHM92_08145, partial [bacterium]
MKTLLNIVISIALSLGSVCNLQAQWVGDPRLVAGVYGLAAFTDGDRGSELFAGTAAGVFRSTDEGLTWTLCNGNLPSPSVTVFSGWQLGQEVSYLCAMTSKGVFLSSDRGVHWLPVDMGFPPREALGFLVASEGMGQNI